MPIKEIIAFGMMSVAAIAASGGPWKLKENLLKAQIQILREVGKTSNWGDPLIWHTETTKFKKTAVKQDKTPANSKLIKFN